MILLNNYIIVAISSVVFIILIQIIRNRAESKRRLGYKERKVLNGIKDENSKKGIKTKEIVSNTRADSIHNSIQASNKSEQKISLNNNVLLENIAQIVDTKLEELGGKAELPKKEGKGVIEERTNKNGKKYYFNTETSIFAKEEDFKKEQKDDPRVDVSGTETFSINSVKIDNQNNEIAKNIDTRLEELGGKAELSKNNDRGIIEERTNKNGKKYYFNTKTRKFAKKEDFIKEQKYDRLVDVSGTETFSINSVEMDNQNYEIAKNIVSSEEKENGRESVPSLPKDDPRVDVSDTETFSINSVETDNQNYEIAKNIVSSEEKENGRESVPSVQKDDRRVEVSGAETFSINSVDNDNQKYEFGLLLLEKKKFNQAIYYFSKAIELNPADGAPYYYRGIARNKLNLLKDAVEDYTNAMLQKLNIVDVFYKRGNCKFRLGDNSGALNDFTRYVSIDKHNPEAYYYKGLLEYETGNYSVVIEDLNRAIELNPNHESAYFKRGMAKEKTGDKKGCYSDLKIAIDKGSLEAYHYLKKFRN